MVNVITLHNGHTLQERPCLYSLKTRELNHTRLRSVVRRSTVGSVGKDLNAGFEEVRIIYEGGKHMLVARHTRTWEPAYTKTSRSIDGLSWSEHQQQWTADECCQHLKEGTIEIPVEQDQHAHLSALNMAIGLELSIRWTPFFALNQSGILGFSIVTGVHPNSITGRTWKLHRVSSWSLLKKSDIPIPNAWSEILTTSISTEYLWRRFPPIELHHIATDLPLYIYIHRVWHWALDGNIIISSIIIRDPSMIGLRTFSKIEQFIQTVISKSIRGCYKDM